MDRGIFAYTAEPVLLNQARLGAPASYTPTVYKVTSENAGKSAQLLWAAEAPDHTYVIAVGLAWQDATDGYAPYVVKLNATTGARVWDVVVVDAAAAPRTTRSGAASSARKSYAGFESVTFTAEGGFVASGFVGASTEPHFKSSGQVGQKGPIEQS